MGTYTDFLEARAYDILPDDDHYIEIKVLRPRSRKYMTGDTCI